MQEGRRGSWHRRMRTLPTPEACGRYLVTITPEHTAMFRFLLEAYGHVAYFSVLEPKTALLKVSFSPHRERDVRRVLAEIGQTIPLQIQDWPYSCQRFESSEIVFSGVTDQL